MGCCAVWDSSIVMAKYFEMHRAELVGKRCLDLSAGCGLVGEPVGLDDCTVNRMKCCCYPECYQ